MTAPGRSSLAPRDSKRAQLWKHLCQHLRRRLRVVHALAPSRRHTTATPTASSCGLTGKAAGVMIPAATPKPLQIEIGSRRRISARRSVHRSQISARRSSRAPRPGRGSRSRRSKAVCPAVRCLMSAEVRWWTEETPPRGHAVHLRLRRYNFHAFGDTKRITTEARFIAVDQKRDTGVSASTVPVVTVNIACPPINLMVGIPCFSLVLHCCGCARERSTPRLVTR